MAVVYPYLLPNGVAIDLQNVVVANDIYNNVVITRGGVKVATVPCGTTAAARALVAKIYNAMSGGSSSIPSVSLVQWSADGSTYYNLPVNIAPGSSFFFQINGTNLPTTGNNIQVDGGPIWLITSSSATQLQMGDFAANMPAGTYDCQVFDINNNLLADLGNIITILSS